MKKLIRKVPNWDVYFINLLEHIASRSKDPNTNVGCIIVDGETNAILSTGYNSLPRGVDDYKHERLDRSKSKYDWMEHAERNAIYNAARHGIRLDGANIYQPWIPCVECARAIIQSGIKKIIFDGRDGNPWKQRSESGGKNWKEEISEEMLEEGGVKLTFLTEKHWM